MPKFTNKTTGVTVDIGDDDILPAPESEWESESGGKRTRRRADTGSVPVQKND